MAAVNTVPQSIVVRILFQNFENNTCFRYSTEIVNYSTRELTHTLPRRFFPCSVYSYLPGILGSPDFLLSIHLPVWKAVTWYWPIRERSKVVLNDIMTLPNFSIVDLGNLLPELPRKKSYGNNNLKTHNKWIKYGINKIHKQNITPIMLEQ